MVEFGVRSTERHRVIMFLYLKEHSVIQQRIKTEDTHLCITVTVNLLNTVGKFVCTVHCMLEVFSKMFQDCLCTEMCMKMPYLSMFSVLFYLSRGLKAFQCVNMQSPFLNFHALIIALALEFNYRL